jgi:glycosyltransferase involved in cell wall biosynthesis
VKVFIDNFDPKSTSGPNGFGLKLARALSYRGHMLVDAHETPDVQLSFIQSLKHTSAPVVQRLDGIWFNTAQNWTAQNEPILRTYNTAKAVIVQSDFDACLVKKFFGEHENMTIVRNGTDIDEVQSVDALCVPSLKDVEKVWCCASSWRPHKRLSENIRYFLEHAGKNDVLVIAGENVDVAVSDRRVFWTGNLDRKTLLSLFRSSDYMLHLAYLDHSPNVVVDARAAGCHVICSSSGGTEEIAGLNSTIIVEDEWDFEPCELYKPPLLDFSKKRQGRFDNSIDIRVVVENYEYVLSKACGV